MKHTPLLMAAVILAPVVFIAAYTKERSGGATNIYWTAKDQARLTPEGCVTGTTGFVCRGE